MEFVEENDKKIDEDEEIPSDRLTIYRILDLYNRKRWNKYRHVNRTPI